MVMEMTASLQDAKDLAEFVALLRAESGDSYKTLGAKIGISHSTLHRLENGGNADDDTLDKIADYAGVTREWLYKLAKGIPARPRYSRAVSLLIAILEQAPEDVQEETLTLARALIESRKKKAAQSNSQLAKG